MKDRLSCIHPTYHALASDSLMLVFTVPSLYSLLRMHLLLISRSFCGECYHCILVLLNPPLCSLGPGWLEISSFFFPFVVCTPYFSSPFFLWSVCQRKTCESNSTLGVSSVLTGSSFPSPLSLVCFVFVFKFESEDKQRGEFFFLARSLGVEVSLEREGGWVGCVFAFQNLKSRFFFGASFLLRVHSSWSALLLTENHPRREKRALP